MVKTKIDANDHLQQYCHLLGHKVSFAYCRSVNSNLPCRAIIGCWKNIFAVEEFVDKIYSKEEIASFLKPSQPKLVQIYDLMIKARKKGSKT
ncbi:MAG: hypothetical protein GTO17_00410 [Candidatus Aminicenantes bacterium]|nr:hypothetical protein [Candidatus Aminicenantes bacterium]